MVQTICNSCVCITSNGSQGARLAGRVLAIGLHMVALRNRICRSPDPLRRTSVGGGLNARQQGWNTVCWQTSAPHGQRLEGVRFGDGQLGVPVRVGAEGEGVLRAAHIDILFSPNKLARWGSYLLSYVISPGGQDFRVSL